jgi:hypothetical protein
LFSGEPDSVYGFYSLRRINSPNIGSSVLRLPPFDEYKKNIKPRAVQWNYGRSKTER